MWIVMPISYTAMGIATVLKSRRNDIEYRAFLWTHCFICVSAKVSNFNGCCGPDSHTLADFSSS